MNFNRTITIITPVTAQIEDISLKNQSSLSKDIIVGWQLNVGGKEPYNGKSHITELTSKHAHFIAKKGTNTIHDIPLSAALVGTNNEPKPFPIQDIDSDGFEIKLNTSETITDKVISITFYILD